MKKLFEQLSLEAGGSHYPTINPNLQQKFGELIVNRIIDKLESELNIAGDREEHYAFATLSSLILEIVDDFDLEPIDPDFDFTKMELV